MARGTLTENERCFDAKGADKQNGLRVRFVDEEGKTERLVSADEVDCSVKKIHILKNRSSSETSLLLRNPSLSKRRSSSDRLSEHFDTLNNNSTVENLNGKLSILKYSEVKIKTDNGTDQTKETNGHYKKNSNVYSVNQAKTLAERKKNTLVMPRLIQHKGHDPTKSSLPSEGSLADSALGKDFTARTLGRLSKGLGRLLRRTNSVRISEPDHVYKVAYLGNVLTGWARGESCIEKPLATLWRNYQQSTKPDVVMKLSVTNSGLKGFTKEHGLTEYWSHRITYCASPPHYPKLFCWVYRHEGKKLKHELRCHAVLCTKEPVSKKITEELQVKLKQALLDFKRDRLSKQNARLSLANSVYDNPSMPRRKILLSVGSMNYRPPLERSKSAPKLFAIEELCSEEDEEEAEMNAHKELRDSWRKSTEDFSTQTLDRRRPEMKSPRKLSCPEGVMNVMRSDTEPSSDNSDLIQLIMESKEVLEASQGEGMHRLESIQESSEMIETDKRLMLSQSNFLVTDSDDGSVSSGCETASTATSDTEPSSLPPHIPHSQEDTKAESPVSVFERIKSFERASIDERRYSNQDVEEVNHVPIGEKNAFRRRSTYPPLGTDSSILTDFENKFESLTDNLTDFDSINSANEGEFKNSGDNESACSDESGYSELLDNGKDSIVGNTIMV